MVNLATVKIFMLNMGMKDAVLSVGTDADEEVCPSSSGTTAVKEIFNHVTAKQGGSILLTKAAREEALSTLAATHLANYSKLSKGPGPSTSLQKTWRDTTSSQPTRSQAKQSTTARTSAFHAASVGMIICGVDRYGAIRVSKAPSKNSMNEIQAMKNHGCYVDEQLFPKVFNYLEAERSRNVSSSQDEKLLWRLLNKSGQQLTVVDIACPTGTDLAKHKGRDKASVTESHLWFGTIFQTLYESWNTQPIVAGSDSEGDPDSSEVELLSDMDSVRDDANHNPELASSLMEMELSDSGDVHADYKGKGLSILKTPMVNAKQTHTALSPDESPTNQRVPVKRLKSETATAVPHFISLQSTSLSQLSIPSIPAAYASCTELSRPVMTVSVSNDNILWRNQPQPDDPFSPATVNPWESEYAIRPVDYLI
ncbi:hypothetical protein BDR04DRAFT_1159261 [Suillus decipiens]|nr:hypothetical protein BDR04DRAFT_1159261 [Suillus decipiens]